MPHLAGPADNGPLGFPRSRGVQGKRCRKAGRLRRCISPDRKPRNGLRRAANREAGSLGPASPTASDRHASSGQGVSEVAAIGLGRRLAAEALGTALLVAVVIGSGITAERLAAGN